MLATLLFAIGLLEDKPLTCPISGEETVVTGPAMEYAGVKYTFCCPDCVATFKKEPVESIKPQVKAGSTVGEFLFDPISTRKIVVKKAKATIDFEGVRYYFESEDNKTKFTKNSKRFANTPNKESLVCPVMGGTVASYSKAADYLDHEGVRYYMCCSGCKPKMEENPAKYSGKKVGEPKVIAVK